MLTNKESTLFTFHDIILIKNIKVHMATRWTIRRGLMLLWFTDFMNVTEEVTIHRPNVSILPSSALIEGLNVITVLNVIKS